MGILCALPRPWENILTTPCLSHRAGCKEQGIVIIFKLLLPCDISARTPPPALTTKLPKKNKDQFLLYASLSAPLQEQCEHFSKRPHQHQANIKHGDRAHVQECPLVSALLTMGGRFSNEPGVEEYPSLVTSTVFSSRKCIPRPPTHPGWKTKCARGSGVCHCVKEPTPNQT